MMGSASNGRDGHRRTQILRAAAELFMAGGYAGVSMDDVQAKVGGSKSTLYRHFADKLDLFTSAVEMMIDERNRPVLDFRPSGSDPAAALIEFGRHFAAIVLDPGAIAVHRLVVAEAERVPELGQAFFEHGPRRGIEALGGHLRGLREQRVIEVDDPLLAASQLYQAMLGSLQMRLLVNAPPAPTEDEVERSITTAVATFLSSCRSGTAAR
ncbi:TetR/AcrR family transcriptional regulator [Actinospica sp. MGRD01-02]|uniref:TetR/AcrR family transcriptional regulator n=1 Tax=Actinospica acidithermotolerans TaxID=2828514 RepID=A0A941EAJ3_9ACTN|nr:TetR/AcrR family transcriptional regulator [Actinospica acidithermotolerans]MBR7826705.1 TetR/AcrR family transcriptional regulator [Actinospica acidithermotolerans]